MGIASIEASEAKAGAKYDRLIAAAKAMPPATTIVVHPCDGRSLRGAADAAEAGIIKPVLVDRRAYILVAVESARIVQPDTGESVMTIPVFPETKVALKGRKGLIVGIANDQSSAWGCAKAFGHWARSSLSPI